MENSRVRFTKLLAKALPSVSGEDLSWRVQFINGGIIHLLMGGDVTPAEEGVSQPLETTLGRFTRFAAAGLREGMPLETPVKKSPQATFDF